MPLGHNNGVVAERTRWKTVATGRGEEGVIGNIFKVEMIPFCESCTSKELVENMVGAFFMSWTVKTGFIETKSEDFGGGNSTLFIEM